METKARAAADQTTRIYEDFDPPTAWEREAGQDTLILHLQDFRKDQLKVQVTSSRNLRIMGERHLGNNKFKRFDKQIPIASNYDSDEISAKFENFKLYITLPKLIAPHEPEPEPEPPADKPASASDSVQAQARGQEQATQRLPSKTGNGNGTAAVDKRQSVGDNVNGSSQEANIPQKTASMEKQRNGNKPSGDPSAKDGSQMGTGEREEARQDVPSKTSAEKTTSRKASGFANAAADDDQKAPGKQEKQPSLKKEKNGGASVDADQNANAVSRKSEGLGDDLGGSAANEEGAEMEKFEDVEASNDGGGKSRVIAKALKQGFGVLVMKLKNSRILHNLVVAVLFLLVSLLYARNAIKSITGKSNDLN